METQKKRKPGRPRLPKHEAKGRIVPIRFSNRDLKLLEAAARDSKRTVSQLIRDLVDAHIVRVEV